MRVSKRLVVLSGLLILSLGFSGLATEVGAAEPSRLPAVAEKTAKLVKLEGLLTLWADAERGELWLELPAGPTDGVVGEYLYAEGIRTGLGSNPVGLDRGQLSSGALVALRRLGGKLLIEEKNLRFRALSDSPVERASVEESFANSVIWAGPIAALDADGRALVDLTPFLLRDSHGTAATLRETGQGEYRLDSTRSTVDLAACLVFPDNLELEAALTFAAAGEAGPLVASVLETPEVITLVHHQSLVRLPAPGYQPRAFDPRMGSFALRFQDYAAPLDAPLVKQWIVRHRLEKSDPTAARSPVKKPIVYYVDPGAPEAVRRALIEGASWWARAFEEAGFLDAFKVEVLPPGAHPQDARYNVIQWVHRSTRGWSYGGGLEDPRTGERIKGHVTLGSLRVRQDRLLFEGLLGTAKNGSGAADDPVELSLARIRQLSAHEVGHALGFSHNFAASTYADRASVMDYPAPKVTVGGGGELDVSDAYGVGVGAWDVHAVRWAYGQFSPGANEAAELERIVREGLAKGYLFLSDADSRPAGSSHPLAHLWDNGADAAAELVNSLAVRRLALSRFDASRVAAGRPLAYAHETFVPVYLHHRYQLEAAVKLVGGVQYRHATVGDGQPPPRPVPAEWQRRALSAVLRTVTPEELAVPDQALDLLVPRPPDDEPHVELFTGATDPHFDVNAAAATATQLALRTLFAPARAARLVEQANRWPELPGLEEVVEAVLAQTFRAKLPTDRRLAEISRAVRGVALEELMELASAEAAPVTVRSRVRGSLARLARELAKRPAATGAEADFLAGLSVELERFLDGKSERRRRGLKAAEAPPGMPIGGATSEEGCSWHVGG